MTKTFITKQLFIVMLFVALSVANAFAQGTGFSFQGRLNDGSNPANGRYDLQFSLFNGITGGTQIGSTIARPNTVLINGVFSVSLDFGANAFNSPNAVFIEIGVKPNASPNAFTILGPRQQLTVVPYAIRASVASNADNATNAQNAVNATTAVTAATATNSLSLGGVAAANYAQLNVINNGDLRTNGALAITGNAFQPATSRGFAKAMVEIDGGSLGRCYNGVLNLSTPPCGFILTEPLGHLAGVFRINFGFPISGSFISATAEYLTNPNGNNAGVSYRRFDATSIELFTWNPASPLDTQVKDSTIILF
jgi:hypothetical protein